MWENITNGLFFIFILALIFHITTRNSRKGRLTKNVPGPFAYPIFGNAVQFNTNCLNEFWEIARRFSNKYYPVMKYWLFKSILLNIRHPDDLEILLSNQKIITKGFPYDYLHPWLKSGLLTSTDEKWRNRRKILTPAFHFSILKKYLDVTNKEGEELVKELKSIDKEIVIDPVELCSNCTLNVICESANGVSLRNLDVAEVDKYKKAVHTMGTIVIYRIPRPYILNWMMPYVYKWGSLQKKTINILHNFTKKVINNRREFHRVTQNKYLKQILDDDDQNTDNIYKRKGKLAMLDLLLVAEQKGLIDAEGIQEEIDTFTFEGHDTTGMAMSYIIMLLADNKEAQDTARAEVTELINSIGKNFTMADLQKLPYLECCIKESLRLFPPVATLVRYAREDIQLKNIFIPADTTVFVHLYDVHRDPNFWPDPNKFDPNRFLPENSVNRHPFAYVPFSAGPRNCIGQKFAMMELKSLIARLLYDFYLEPVDKISEIKIIADLIIRPLKPVRVKFIKINK